MCLYVFILVQIGIVFTCQLVFRLHKRAVSSLYLYLVNV